jgi:hypothetical protein
VGEKLPPLKVQGMAQAIENGTWVTIDLPMKDH